MKKTLMLLCSALAVVAIFAIACGEKPVCKLSANPDVDSLKPLCAAMIKDSTCKGLPFCKWENPDCKVKDKTGLEDTCKKASKTDCEDMKSICMAI